MKKILAERHINFYTIDGIKIGKEIGLGGRINTVLQSAFFKIADIIPADKAKELMKAAAKKSYMKKGQAIVDMNYAAIDRGMEDLKKVEIPADWANAVDNSVADKAEGNGALVEYVNEILKPVNAYKGNKLPVSTFMDHVDGTAPNGSAAYEKRGIAVDVPEWNPENCIQCNRCAIVCPHAVIRPVAMTADELAKAPEGTKSLPMMGLKDLNFVMTVSTLDCTGCGACAQVCPGKKGAKALTMQSIDSQRPKQAVFDYALTLEDKPEVHEKFKFTTVKGSQFKQPLLEFSGACAGCGETPYAKLVTQLFGDRMFMLTQQAVHQFGVHLLLQHLIQRIRRVTVLLGRTHSLKITQSSVLVWLSVRRLSATDLSSMLRVFRRIQTALTSRQLVRTISTQ